MKILSVTILLLLLNGCATFGEYLSNATHGCMYEKDGKKKGPFPVQLKPGMPTVWEEDGWSVICEEYDKVEPAPDTPDAV